VRCGENNRRERPSLGKERTGTKPKANLQTLAHKQIETGQFQLSTHENLQDRGSLTPIHSNLSCLQLFWDGDFGSRCAAGDRASIPGPHKGVPFPPKEQKRKTKAGPHSTPLRAGFRLTTPNLHPSDEDLSPGTPWAEMRLGPLFAPHEQIRKATADPSAALGMTVWW